MPYGDDITEAIPYVLSNPVASISYGSGGEAYDIAVNGVPFFLATSDETPYRRETAAYRKQQIDQSNEPGEQSITGWWVRAQSSFHNGDGINYYDPSSGETVSYRYADSKGVNVWNKGKLTLLKSCAQGHVVTGPIQSNGRAFQTVRSIKWSTNEGILLLDEYDVDKINTSGTVTHFIDYNAGTDSPVYAICDDGTTAYWVTNKVSGTNKMTVLSKPLTGDSSTAETTMFSAASGTVSNAVMEYVKERIIMCADNKVYEFSSGATALPAPLYTHPASTHVYTSITASGPAIYIAGYNGIQSTISKFTLNTSTGALPTLSSAIIAAEMPVGEIIHKIYYYLGYMMIGTNKGIRAALVSDQDGSIAYGPLIVETSQPCYDFAARDSFVWCATSVDGEPGLIRINLETQIEPLRFAWANDVYYPGVTGHQTTSCAFMDGTSRIAFTTTYASAANGNVYIENASTLLSQGYLTTGAIRYGTLENKVFKTLKARVNNATGGLTIESIDSLENVYTIGNFAEKDFTPEVNIFYPQGPQEYMSFKFTLKRFTEDNTKGPTFNGYQLKSLPSIPRQRLIQYPISCYDREIDVNGVQIGYENRAFENMSSLEIIENTGDSIRIEDFRTNESYLGLIESIQFVNKTPTDKRNSGFGGILLLTIRTL
jgi:hypothetical protein